MALLNFKLLIYVWIDRGGSIEDGKCLDENSLELHYEASTPIILMAVGIVFVTTFCVAFLLEKIFTTGK